MDQKTHFTDIKSLMTMAPAAKNKGRKPTADDLGIIENASLVIGGGRILYCGESSDLPSEFLKIEKVSLEDEHVFPGFVDCHTHLVFAGDRTAEFEKRNAGVTYQEIAASGGGILRTVNATRSASQKNLLVEAQARVDEFLRQGVTTLEVKSGYGLNKSDELKMLRVAQELAGPNVVTTFLGAHALPPEFEGFQEYLESLKEILKEAKSLELCQRVDIFVEAGYFSAEQAKNYLAYAKSLGFDLTMHVDQFKSIGGLDVALELEMQSVDHIVETSESDLKKLSNSSTVGVLLPVADFYLKTPYPKARFLIDQGGMFAVASDYNPGSSPNKNINFLGLLCRLKMQMSFPEVFCGLTVGGAQALGQLDQVGSLEVGKIGNFFVSSTRWDEFFYGAETQWAKGVWVNGLKKI